MELGSGTVLIESDYQPDFVSISEEMGLRKDTVRMRFKRLSDRIHAAIAAEQTSGTSQGSGIKEEDSDAMQQDTKSAEESQDDKTPEH